MSKVEKKTRKSPDEFALLDQLIKFGTDAIFTPEERMILGIHDGPVCSLDGPNVRQVTLLTLDWEIQYNGRRNEHILVTRFTDQESCTATVDSYYHTLVDVISEVDPDGGAFLDVLKSHILSELAKFHTAKCLDKWDLIDRVFQKWHARFRRLFALLSCYIDTDNWGEDCSYDTDDDCSRCQCPSRNDCSNCPYPGDESWCDHKEDKDEGSDSDGPVAVRTLGGCPDNEDDHCVYPYFGCNRDDIEDLLPDQELNPALVYVQVPTVGPVELLRYLFYTIDALYKTISEHKERVVGLHSLVTLAVVCGNAVSLDKEYHVFDDTDVEALQEDLDNFHDFLAELIPYLDGKVALPEPEDGDIEEVDEIIHNMDVVLKMLEKHIYEKHHLASIKVLDKLDRDDTIEGDDDWDYDDDDEEDDDSSAPDWLIYPEKTDFPKGYVVTTKGACEISEFIGRVLGVLEDVFSDEELRSLSGDTDKASKIIKEMKDTMFELDVQYNYSRRIGMKMDADAVMDYIRKLDGIRDRFFEAIHIDKSDFGEIAIYPEVFGGVFWDDDMKPEEMYDYAKNLMQDVGDAVMKHLSSINNINNELNPNEESDNKEHYPKSSDASDSSATPQNFYYEDADGITHLVNLLTDNVKEKARAEAKDTVVDTLAKFLAALDKHFDTLNDNSDIPEDVLDGLKDKLRNLIDQPASDPDDEDDYDSTWDEGWKHIDNNVESKPTAKTSSESFPNNIGTPELAFAKLHDALRPDTAEVQTGIVDIDNLVEQKIKAKIIDNECLKNIEKNVTTIMDNLNAWRKEDVVDHNEEVKTDPTPVTPRHRNFTERETMMLESLMRVHYLLRFLGPDNISNTFWLIREIMLKGINE